MFKRCDFRARRKEGCEATDTVAWCTCLPLSCCQQQIILLNKSGNRSRKLLLGLSPHSVEKNFCLKLFVRVHFFNSDL